MSVSTGIRYATADVCDRKAFLSVLHSISDRYSTHIICFDADRMAGKRHAEMAVRLACRSLKEGTAISKSLEMEALLYAAGTRQCSMAVSSGLHEGNNRLYICCCPDSTGAWKDLEASVTFADDPDDDGFTAEKAARLAALYGIIPEELDAAGQDRLLDLVLERVALLEVSK